MIDFKVGDIVTYNTPLAKVHEGKLEILKIKGTGMGEVEVKQISSGFEFNVSLYSIKHASLFSVGDKLESNKFNNTPVTVIHVLDDGIIVTKDDLSNEVNAYFEDEICSDYGYYIKSSKDGLKEFTLQEIADKLKINVTDLRIRD